MKWIGLCLILLWQSAAATPPSRGVAWSCLTGRPFSPGIDFMEIPTNEIASDDSYKQGYAATFLMKIGNLDVGYAVRRDEGALIYSSELYALKSASNFLKLRHFKPSNFNPELAQWSTVADSTGRYLCASFNFDGVGRSGSFQNVHAGYLLAIKPPRRLYYLVADVRKLSKVPHVGLTPQER